MPIYMNYDGIPGDVTSAGHEQWIELSSFQWAPVSHDHVDRRRLGP